ncbi:MAG: hypothetical protein ABL878_14720 [Burkholderiales bacterium]
MTNTNRRERFLLDLTCAMRLAEGPHGLGEFYCQAPQWEQDRANAALWFDAMFFESFSIDDFPELPDAVRVSLSALVASFRRTALDSASDCNNARVLASTHLWSIIERLRPTLEVYWASHAVSNNTIERSRDR